MHNNPNRAQRAVIVLVGLLTSLSAARCTAPGENLRVAYSNMPPLANIDQRRATLIPKSQRYKIATLTFIDQTGKASLVTDSIADILTTELFYTKRFDQYDRADLTQDVRTKDPTIIRSKDTEEGDKGAKRVRESTKVVERSESFIPPSKTAKQYAKVLDSVDGILIGYITSFRTTKEEEQPKRGRRPPKRPVIDKGKQQEGEFEFDFRIVNGSIGTQKKLHANLKNLVVFSGSGKVRFKTDATMSSVNVRREDVRKVAAKIKDGFTGDFGRLSKNDQIRITKVEGRKITLSVGENVNMKQGFAGFVVRPIPKLKTYEYLAEFVVINIFEKASIGIVTSPDKYLGNVKVGAIVRIK